MKTFGHSGIISMFFLAACVGTDVLPDPSAPGPAVTDTIVTIEILPGSAALLPGDSVQFTARYLENETEKQNVVFEWKSSDPALLSISATGLAKAIDTGSVTVTATAFQKESAPVPVKITSDTTVPALLKIETTSTLLQLNAAPEAISFSAYNVLGNPLTGISPMWKVEGTAVTVNEAGQLVVAAEGMANVWAEVEGLRSNTLKINVVPEAKTSKTGTFSSANGYQTSGTATLYINESNRLILEFSDDFSTDFALGTFIYLANSTTGSTVIATGLDLGEIFSSGKKIFDITEKSPGTTINTYSYALVICKPAQLTFGIAELK